MLIRELKVYQFLGQAFLREILTQLFSGQSGAETRKSLKNTWGFIPRSGFVNRKQKVHLISESFDKKIVCAFVSSSDPISLLRVATVWGQLVWRLASITLKAYLLVFLVFLTCQPIQLTLRLRKIFMHHSLYKVFWLLNENITKFSNIDRNKVSSTIGEERQLHEVKTTDSLARGYKTFSRWSKINTTWVISFWIVINEWRKSDETTDQTFYMKMLACKFYEIFCWHDISTWRSFRILQQKFLKMEIEREE